MKEFIYSFGEDDFEFEPELSDLKKALKEALLKEAKVDGANDQACKVVDYIVDELDLMDELHENLYLELHDYFEEKAFEEFENTKSTQSDRDDWYGTRSNVVGI